MVDSLTFINVGLLVTLAVTAGRLAPGAPSVRERLSWSLIAAGAIYAAVHWLVIHFTTDLRVGPFENQIRMVVLAGGVLALLTGAPSLRAQRNAERERQEAEERFRRTMDGSSEPMALVDADGVYRYVNAAGVALFRYPAEQVIGRHYTDFVVGDTEAGANLQRALQGPLGRTSVVRTIRRGDGSEATVETEMIGLGDGNMLFVGHDVTDRVELAERLERERMRLRLAQEVAHVGSVEIDLVTGERWWSEEMFRLHGLEPGGSVPEYHDIWRRIHPEDRAIAQRYSEEVLAGRDHEPFTFRLVLQSGAIRHLLQHSRIEYDASGRPVRATRVLTDVTTLQEAQAGLEHERIRLRLAQDISGVGSGDTNLITGERWWSPQMFRLFGMEPSDTAPPFEVARLRVHPDDRHITEQSTQEVLQGRTHEPVSYRVVMPDGEVRHILMHASLERDNAGEPMRVTRVAMDVTQLRLLQADLERERTRLRYAQEVSRVGSGEWDLQTGETWWSDTMFRLLDFEPGSVTPSRELFVARLLPEDRDLYTDALTRLLTGRQPSPTLLRIQQADGTLRSLLCQLTLERDTTGVPSLVTGVFSDVTDFLALQEQLGRSKRLEAIGTLTAGIAHDFNNLLTVIGGSVELAAMGDVGRLAQAEQAIQRATTLIRQLLQFSRPGEVDAPSEAASLVDLRTIAREAVEAMHSTHDGLISCDLPKQAVLATVDPTRVHRVLMNLLVNAWDAVEDAAATDADRRPEVRVYLAATAATESRPAGVEISVADNGTGMSPDVRDRVFEPFFSTKPPGRGTGLGLATVYGTIRDMSGTVDLTSEVGVGTTFTIWIPVAPPARRAEAQPDATARDMHILILDDQRDLLDFASEVLTRAQFNVTTACSTEEAVQLIRERPFDLAILDAFVDAARVDETVARIKAIRPQQHLMLSSGSASRAQAIAWGADEFLPKPYDGETLLRAVRAAVGVPESMPV